MKPALKATTQSFKKSRPHLKYQVEWTDDGGRHRKFFTNRAEALDFRNELEVRTAQAGVDAASVDANTIRAWLDLVKRAEAAGGTLEKAVDLFERHQAARGRSMPVGEAVETFLEHREKLGRAERTVDNLRSRLKPFVQISGERLVAEIVLGDVDRFLSGVKGRALTRNHYRAALHAFFGWAVKSGLCDENPVHAVEKATVRPCAPGVLSPELMRLAFAITPSELWTELALGAFAGLRESEIVRLRWSDIDLERGHIDLRRIGTKNNASWRLVEVLPACRAFLEAVRPAFDRGASVLPKRHDAMRRALRMALRDRGVEWPPNALRHSFASYHLALHQDGGKLALQLGHGGGMSVLMRHYREIVSPEAAREWFEIRPASVDGEKKVVGMGYGWTA